MPSSLIIEPFLKSIKEEKTKKELFFERQIILKAVINRVEEETGTKITYDETPEVFNKVLKQEECTFLDLLKRYACYLTFQDRPPVIPGSAEPNDAHRVIQKYITSYLDGNDLPYKHLILPSYPSCYYIPLDFHMPLIIDSEMYLNILREHFKHINLDVTSHRDTIIVASTIRLLSELDELDEILNAIKMDFTKEDPFYDEKLILNKFYNFVKFAVNKKQAIVWKEKSCTI